MNNAGVTAEVLLRAFRLVNDVTNEVESAKKRLSDKYLNLSSEWHGDKYLEMGMIISDCFQALDRMIEIFGQTEQQLGLMAKALADYESVQLAGSNGAGETPQAPATGNSLYVNGVETHGNIPKEYSELLSRRSRDAAPNARQAFEHFSGRLVIQNAEYPADRTAHYAPCDREGQSRGVYYNAEADMHNPRGAGTTYYHELGHMIDHAAGGFEGLISSSSRFEDALREDGMRLLSVYEDLDKDQQEAFVRRLYQDSAHSLSDLIDGITGGRLHGKYSHPRNYWNVSGNLQAEGFAHFFEASMGGGRKLELLSNFFPTAFEAFNEMLDSLEMPD